MGGDTNHDIQHSLGKYAVGSMNQASSLGKVLVFDAPVSKAHPISGRPMKMNNKEMLETVDISTSRIQKTIVLLDDMWRFNGDKASPDFAEIKVGLSFPGSAQHWPPAGVGNGWVSGQNLLLWTPPQAETGGGGGRRRTNPLWEKSSKASLWRVPNQLWVFSVQLQQWERVGGGGLGFARGTSWGYNGGQLGSADPSSSSSGSGSAKGLAWPGPRDGALLADGFLFGGVGDAAGCGGSDHDTAQSLVGMWRLSGAPQ